MVDEPIDLLIQQILRGLGSFSASDAIEQAYQKQVCQKSAEMHSLQRDIVKTEKDLQNLQNEILKAIDGTSAFDLSILNDMVLKLNATHTEQLTQLSSMQEEENEERLIVQQMQRSYNQMVEWYDVYASATMETKKMIAAQLIERIEVFSGYKFKIHLSLTAKQFMEQTNLEVLSGNENRIIQLE